MTTTYAPTQAASTGTRFSTLRANIVARLARHRLYRQTFAELSLLSDRDLTDLGLHRTQIASIASEAAYGKK